MILLFLISQNFPKPYGYVNDYAKILNNVQIQDLENQIKEIENKTSVEIAIAIFDSIGYPIEEYANLLFEKWGIGKKKEDNGLLIILSLKERVVRIEVGYGLESIITDGIAGEIIRKKMIPYFREGNFYLGLKNAINEIQNIIEQNYEVPKNSYKKEKEDIWFFIFGLFLGLFLGLSFGYFSIILSILSFILFIVSKSITILFISIGFFIGWLLLVRKIIDIDRSVSSGGGFGGFGGGSSDWGSSRGGFGGFGGGLSGGGGATGRW